jgi:hypothetical protein
VGEGITVGARVAGGSGIEVAVGAGEFVDKILSGEAMGTNGVG